MTPAFSFTPNEVAGLLLDKLIKDGKVKAPTVGPFYLPKGKWIISTSPDSTIFIFDPNDFVIGLDPDKAVKIS